MRDYFLMGVDPSLACTGVAVLAPDGVITTARMPTKPHHGFAEFDQRIESIRNGVTLAHGSAVRAFRDRQHVPLVRNWWDLHYVVERPGFATKNPHKETLWYAWQAVNIEMVVGLEATEPVMVSPDQRGKYAVGNGRAAKSVVKATMRERFPELSKMDDNEADALVLLCIGARLLEDPIDEQPLPKNLEVFEKIAPPSGWGGKEW